MNVRMMPPQGPMGQPQPMGGAPAPMPPQGGPMPVPPMQGQPTAGQQKGQGLGSTFGGSAQGRQGFKQFMAAKKQTSAMVPQIPQAQMPMPQAPMGAQPMLPAPSPQMMGAMKPMGAPQMGGPVQAGRPMRGTQGGLGSAPVQLNRGGAVPRQTEIMGQPHMLAYINPEEEALLRGLGGAGAPGPGGIPAYWSLSGFINDTFGTSIKDSSGNVASNKSSGGGGGRKMDADLSVGAINTGGTYSGSDPIVSGGFNYSDDNDNKPAVTVSTGSSGYPSLDATANNVVSTGTLIDLSGAASSGYYEPPGFDFDGDGISGEGSDVLDNNVDDDPFVDLPDYSDDNVTPIYDDSDSGYGGDSDETDFSQPVVSPPVVDTTPPPPVYTPPPPPPKYYDMFGGEHSTQAAADAADAQYEAQAVAAEAVETVTSTPETTYSYTGAGADTDAGGDTDPASMYETNIFREANVPIPESYMPTSEDFMPGITGTGTGTAAADRTEAEENAIRALYGMEPIGADTDEEEDNLETAVEDIYNIGLGGEFGGLDLDVPEAEADVGLEAASAEFPTGPFETPEQTGLEQFEEQQYIDYAPGTTEDFTSDMTDMARYEMEQNLRDYYTTGAGSDGATQDIYMPTDESFALASEDMSPLDEIAEATALEFEDLYPDSDDTLSIEVDDPNIIDFDIRDPEEDTGLFPEDEGEDEIVVGGEDDQQPTSTTTASQDYLSAMKKLDDPNSMTEAEQRALYGARGQVPNAAETAYLQKLLSNAKHAEDGPIDTREKIPASGLTTYGSYIDENGNFVGSDEITGGTGFDAQGNPIMIDNPNFGKPMYEAGDNVTEQSLSDMFEDLLISGLDMFVNPLSILGEKFTLEGQQDAYVQEQLDAYKNGGTFVYGEDGKTVVGVAKPNYDADGDGVNDTVVLNNANNDFSSGDDDIIVSSDGISISDVEINDNVDGEDEDDDIEIVFNDTTFENTEDGVVEESVGGPDTTTTGGDNPCPDGYSLVDGMCQPDDGIGTEEGDEAAARVNLRLRKIDRGGGDLPDATIPDPVEGEALIVRKPAQFFEGGGVYGPDAEGDDYDRYYRSSGDQGYIVSDYGPGYSEYQIGFGEDPSAIINFLDQQGFRETAPADSMDDGSAFLGFGGNQTTQGQQGQTSLPVFNPVMPDPTDPTIPDYETPVDPDPIADPIHDPRKMIIRAPKQFDTAYDGIVFNPDTDPLKRFMDNSKAVPFSGQKVRKTAQFAQGGMVTPNIDRFLQSLGS